MDTLGALVDLERYPLGEPRHPRIRALVDEAARAMRERFLYLLPGFVHAGGLTRLLAEVDERRPLAERRFMKRTPYSFKPVDETLPAGHPRRHHETYDLTMYCGEAFDEASSLRGLYRSPALLGFLGAVIGRPVYCSEDPTYGLIVTELAPGGEHGWHFDTNEFVTSILLAGAGAGGVFEYVPGIRSDAHERYDEVGAVLGGERSAVVPVPVEAGTLILFHGHYSLHRVSRVEGEKVRRIALLSYAERPGQTFDRERFRGDALEGAP